MAIAEAPFQRRTLLNSQVMEILHAPSLPPTEPPPQSKPTRKQLIKQELYLRATEAYNSIPLDRGSINYNDFVERYIAENYRQVSRTVDRQLQPEH